MMKSKFVHAFMKTAWIFSELSSAVRLKVGCIIVKDDTIIGIGYNGMPSGWTNNCEYKIYPKDGDNISDFPNVEESYESGFKEIRFRLATRPEVLHAESNAIAKVARSTMSSVGSTLFVTHAPCIECAKIIHQAGINEVYYDLDYRSSDGIKFLNQTSNIIVSRYHVSSK